MIITSPCPTLRGYSPRRLIIPRARLPLWPRMPQLAVPSFVNGTQAASASANNLGCLITWASNAGDMLTGYIRVGSLTATVAVADSNGSWSLAMPARQQTSDGHTAYIYKFPNIAGALANTNTVTVTLTGGPASIRFAVLEDAGVSGSVDNQISNLGTSTSPASGVVAMGNANDILRGFITQNGAIALTSPGFAGGPGGSVNVRQALSTFYSVFDIVAPGTTGSYGSTGTQGTSQAWTASVIGFLPSSTARIPGRRPNTLLRM